MISLRALNDLNVAEFTGALAHVFEHSPWIPERAAIHRPFASVGQLHDSLVATMYSATPEEQLRLIRAHPDLVGRLAREHRLTAESTAEQRAAGLAVLSAAELAAFESNNAAYRERFGFPFVICARENRKEAILAAFPLRLRNSADEETRIALAEIAKIARLRLLDTVSES